MHTAEPVSSSTRTTEAPAAPPGGARGRGWRGSLRRAVPALILFAAARLAGAALLTVWGLHAGLHPRSLLGQSWDARWYERIAEWGYGTFIPSVSTQGWSFSDLAFFPLYPALIRALSALLPIGPVNSALLIAWFAAALAAWGIHAIGERLYGRRAGIALVLLWGLLPHSIVLTMAYTEPVLTACAAWALYALLTRRWLAAGLLASLAGLARPNGIAVAVAVCVTVVADAWRRRREGRPQDLTAWAGAVVAPLGWSGYVGWVGLQTGGPRGYFGVQSRWGSDFDFGRNALDYVRRLILGSSQLANYMVVLIAAAALLLLVLALLQRIPLPLAVYAVVLVVIALGGSHYFASKPRFLLPAFPLLIPAALALAKARPRTAAVAVAALAGLSFFYGTYLLTVVSAPI
ncbi:glycosyltransferase family 39 protein [Streptomyces sp. H10-C2]|uniref:glycosyltransferase family 39 protein n=1 Tax=unclassified Streptomyces TaxID=2593676 RepID=UPI0024BA87F1|nr:MULTISPECIES: glycosyltransferase family 39 protein [unclassified Streptomyces]MDJ0340383.1 glycosyltransferase family 39 protein [Streptomyces sp. PH10-H1]MDJ0368169.1 glycosyltransferase family 39 protein [Streptomyces sp. H10-C2]